MPGAPHPATATLRPCGFNETVVADLKYVKDSKGKTWVALSMVDTGTCWHVAITLRNRKPRHVARKLIDGWIRHYGCPRHLIVAQGGEFEGYCNDKCDKLGIDASVTASHAAWQQGLAERHGGLLGTIFRMVCYQHKINRGSSVSLALALCCQAKNSLMTRNGLTAEQAVFGRSLRFTELGTVDDGDEVLVSVLGPYGPAWRAAQIRTAAKMHLLQGDASDKVRRAMLPLRVPGIIIL